MSPLRSPIFRYVVFGVAGLLLLVLAVRPFLGERKLPPAELAKLALDAPSAQEREEAAIELAQCGIDEIELSRRVFLESDTPEVRAVIAQSLGHYLDVDSLPHLIDAMEDPSPLLRERAGVAVQEIVGIDVSFAADAPLAERQEKVAFYRKFWKDAQAPGSKYIEYMKNQAEAKASAERTYNASKEPMP